MLKRELRKRMKQLLKSVPRSQIAQESAFLTEAITKHDYYKAANTIAVYASQPTEVDTSGLISHALRANKQVFLPRVLSMATRSMTMIEVRSVEDLGSFERGAYDIPEPPLDPNRRRAPDDVSLDLVVVPGVAFDLSGRRLGHGKGFYDVYLDRCKSMLGVNAQPDMPKLVALALSIQIVEDVPVDDSDWIVDQVVVAPQSANKANK